MANATDAVTELTCSKCGSPDVRKRVIDETWSDNRGEPYRVVIVARHIVCRTCDGVTDVPRGNVTAARSPATPSA